MITPEKMIIAKKVIDSELLNTSHAFILNSNQVKPQVIPNPGDGTVIGTI